MTSRRLRILLVGEQAAAIRVLRVLAETPHELVAVATTLEPAAARTSTVAQAAERLSLPLLPAERVRDPAFAAWIHDHRVDVCLNVFSLHVAAPETVAAPRVGSFNLHPGPLPAYGGLNTPSWAIYHGESDHAVTLHWMTDVVDAGPVAYEAAFGIDERETGLSLTRKCVRHGLPLVERLLIDASAGAVPSVAQDESRRRFFGAGVPEDGRLRWSRPARELDRFVRACDYLPFLSPWGHPRTRLRGTEDWVELTRVSLTGEAACEEPGTVQRVEGAGVVVAAADERLLVEGARLGGTSRAPGELQPVDPELDDGSADVTARRPTTGGMHA
jgi:methionyl-tRNA formyltransferase